MSPKTRFITAALLSLGALAPLHAQMTDAEITADAKVMADAATLRAGSAGALARGSAKPAEIIAKLKGTPKASGLKIDSDADFSFAALDVGQRLIAAGKPAEAEAFFREAEKSLEKMLKKTPDTATAEKALYLSKLALIRANYLNNAAQAKTDLDAAKILRPDDKYLATLRDTLGSEHGDVFTEKPKG